MKPIYYAKNPAEAELLKSILEENGIPTITEGEHLSTLRGMLPMTTDSLIAIEILNKDDQKRAEEIVMEFLREQSQPTPSAPAWKCPQCGEEVEGQFSACWKCGQPRS